METIVSLQNQRVKQAIKLRDRRGRDKQQRLIIDGVREIRRAISANLVWSEAFICEESLAADAMNLVGDLERCGAEIVHVSSQVFAKLAFGQRSEGVVALARVPQRTLDGLELPPDPIIAVLENIEKPGNVGAILRSADAAGISAVILADPRTDLFNPNTIRASQGAVFTLPTATATSAEVLSWLREEEFKLFSARVDAKAEYVCVSYKPPCAIVLGNEAEGISSAWRGEDLTPIRLPMLGNVDSLNVSVTAGVLFYEAWRQQRS